MNRKKMVLTIGGGQSAAFVGAYDAIPNLVHVYEPARRTLSAYTGSLVRLRRSTDNAESDFGYVTATGELDTAAIAAWLGAGTGFIVTIYDQVGGNNLTMATAARQPAYTADAKNGHAGGTWDGSASIGQSDALQVAFSGAVAQPFSVYAVAQLAVAKVNNGAFVSLVDSNGVSDRCYITQYPVDTPDSWIINAGLGLATGPSDANFNLWAVLFSGASSRIYINNGPVTLGNASTNSLGGLTLGSNFVFDEGASWRGPICSCVIATSHSDDNRLAMQEAINTYWDMYAPFELPAGEPDFSIVHIRDTQVQVQADTHYIFDAAAQWIVDNRVSEKIAAVIHTGDIVISDPDDDTAWGYAGQSIGILDGVSTLPLLFATGNHDYGPPAAGTTPTARPLVNWTLRLGQDYYTGKSWWSGGFYEDGRSENAYLLVTMGGVDYIILALEFGPRQAVVDWANTILTTYAARDAIIITHSYMWRDHSLCTPTDEYSPHLIMSGEGSDDTHSGDELWTELVKLHSNIVQVFCGHERSIYCLESTGDGGNHVAQLLNGHDFENDMFGIVIVRYYLSQNLVAYTRYQPITGKTDYSVNLTYKNA